MPRRRGQRDDPGLGEAIRGRIGIADLIAACGCKASIPRVKALLYMGQRGPD